MYRFITFAAGLLVLMPLQNQAAAPGSTHPASAQIDSFNYVIGTQTFSPSYQFTSEPSLLETAEAIQDMGSTVIKFEMSRRYARRYGVSAGQIPPIHSLTELASEEPAHRKVLDMPFAYYVLWAHTFSMNGDNSWRKGFPKEAQDKEYREMYDFVAYLLKTYSGSGKTFCLGHWEGDGWLRGSVRPEDRYSPSEQDALSRRVMQVGLEWGCPFVLYWEMYNNEVDENGKQRGFWLIDDKGGKQTLYYTHQRFYRWAKDYAAAFTKNEGRSPTSDEFRKAAVTFLDGSGVVGQK